jgi:hypothetical protein
LDSAREGIYLPEEKAFVVKDINNEVDMRGKKTEPAILSTHYSGKGAHDSVVVKALCYKPEGRGFDTR